MKLQQSETFLIPIGEQFGLSNDSVQVFYSPLHDEIALVDNETAEQLIVHCHEGAADNDDIQDLYNTFFADEIHDIPVRDVMQSRRMSIIPNLICNFSCSYCYSAKGRSNMQLDWEKAQMALDFFISRRRIESGSLSLFISGGGEPLITWPLTRQIIEYANHRAEEQGLTIYIAVITNASLVTAEIAQALKDSHCTVGVSFEILEELQNAQRKDWEKVRKGIHLLHEAGVTVKINSTITPLSVNRMKEMAECLAVEYPFVKQYTMEPVTGAELFASPAEMRDFYNTFFKNYLECKQLSEVLRFTFDDTMRSTVTRHCPGKFCVVPSGHISVCHLVSSDKENRFGDCVYGKVTNDGVHIDKECFAELYNKNVLTYPECKDCFAKWSCGGECLTRRQTYPKEYLDEVCRFNRRFVLYQLMERLRKTIAEEYGISLEEYVSQEN